VTVVPPLVDWLPYIATEQPEKARHRRTERLVRAGMLI